jgi:hypothetical protein
MLPYENSTSGDRALLEIQKLLHGFGCTKFGSMIDWEKGELIVQFEWRGRKIHHLEYTGGCRESDVVKGGTRMKIIIESTAKIVELNGVPARIWEGTTESGIPVHAFITRIAAPETADLKEFERELQACRAPSLDVQAYPVRLVL